MQYKIGNQKTFFKIYRSIQEEIYILDDKSITCTHKPFSNSFTNKPVIQIVLKISSKYSRVIFTGLRTRSHQTCFKHMIFSTNRSKPFVLVSAHISRKTAVTPREDSFIELVKNDKYAHNHQLCFHRLRYYKWFKVLFESRKNSGNIS